ncbi:hypothetical protein AGMMS49928_28940 [Spirochaetia bacterium]|nr:hypothetical protein AGMMS49928_28940 [Spirochaetia bacterium]
MTSESIIKAAFHVWGRELYLSTSLVQVARELGVSKTALYRHFTGKQALLEAMRTHFFDDYSQFIRQGYEKALGIADLRERILVMIRSITEYYVRNRDASLFALIMVFGSKDAGSMMGPMQERGVDLKNLLSPGSPELPFLFNMIMATTTFRLAVFHRLECSDGTAEAPAEGLVGETVASIERHIRRGLGLNRAELEPLDCEGLENSLALDFGAMHDDDGLLKAVAQAVAEAGPWDASMDMVARRSGLSKSGLYAHFKNKEDMIRQLFLTEFDRIAFFVETSTGDAGRPGDRLYLMVFSAAAYLRSNPEILIALDWIRNRRLNMGPPRTLKIFEIMGRSVPPGAGENAGLTTEQMVHWVLFLIINALMYRPQGMDFADLPNSRIRSLYKFITLGLEGFES